MAELNVLQVVLSMIASAIGALVAGYSGVWFGRSKIRHERAFDRRLAWYEETRNKVHGILLFCEGMVGTLRLGFPIDESEFEQKFPELSATLSDVCDAAEMYATRRTVEAAWVARDRFVLALTEFFGNMPTEAVTRGGLVSDERLQEKLIDEFFRLFEELRQCVQTLRNCLVADVRYHLSLELLPSSTIRSHETSVDTMLAKQRLIIVEESQLTRKAQALAEHMKTQGMPTIREILDRSRSKRAP